MNEETTTMTGEIVAEEQRDGFQSKWGFILACIGSAVGMGNIWRFPVMVSKYGGMTFLIPFFFFVILIAATGVIEEMSFGRIAKAGPIGAFGTATELRWHDRKKGEWIGMIPVLGSLALAIGYTCVVGWVVKYTYLAFTGGLSAMGQDLPQIAGLFEATATSFGNNFWLIVACLGSFLIMGMGVASGIEKANKIMMPALFAMFLFLLCYVFILDGAEGGYRYIFTFNPEGLKNPFVWVYAFGQAFFTLSIAGSGTVIYGSYLSDKEDVVGAAKYVAFFNLLSAMLAACFIIPAMAITGEKLSSGGPGLMFIHLIPVFNGMPAGRLVVIIFFICVLFAGVSSLVNLYEAPVATLQEQFGFKRMPAVATIGVLGCVSALLIQGIVSEWMDVVSIYICPLGAVLAGVMFYWVGGKEFVLKAVNTGREKPIGAWFYPLGKYVFCIIAIAALVIGAALGGIG